MLDDVIHAQGKAHYQETHGAKSHFQGRAKPLHAKTQHVPAGAACCRRRSAQAGLDTHAHRLDPGPYAVHAELVHLLPRLAYGIAQPVEARAHGVHALDYCRPALETDRPRQFRPHAPKGATDAIAGPANLATQNIHAAAKRLAV